MILADIIQINRNNKKEQFTSKMQCIFIIKLYLITSIRLLINIGNLGFSENHFLGNYRPFFILLLEFISLGLSTLIKLWIIYLNKFKKILYIYVVLCMISNSHTISVNMRQHNLDKIDYVRCWQKIQLKVSQDGSSMMINRHK